MSIGKLLLFLDEYIFVCLGSMTAYAFFKDKKYISFLILFFGAALCFILPENPFALIAFAAADIALALILSFTDPYRFIRNSSLTKRPGKTISHIKFPVLKYITRYITSHKSYMVSSVMIILFCGYLSKTMGDMGFKGSSMVGMALLSVNTPLALVVSSSRNLKTKLCSMPDRIRCFFVPYASFLFVFYIAAYSILLLTLGFTGAAVNWVTVVAAVAFALQASAFTACMEEKFTIVKWKTESDLWHNPRKYIMPVVLTAEAMIFQMFI